MSKTAQCKPNSVDQRIASIGKVQAELAENQRHVMELVGSAQYDPTRAILGGMIAFAGVLILGAAAANMLMS